MKIGDHGAQIADKAPEHAVLNIAHVLQSHFSCRRVSYDLATCEIRLDGGSGKQAVLLTVREESCHDSGSD